jgi:RNA polymerase sigma-70 factor (ECF subfamily)
MPWIRSEATSIPAEALDVCEPSASERARALYDRHGEDVFNYVAHRVARREEAEDITAEVFAAAVQALPCFRGQCPVYLWLLSIARRKIADSRRRAPRRELLASEVTEEGLEAGTRWDRGWAATIEGPEATVMREESRRVLRDLVAGLNPSQREALMLQYVERLSVAEIAHVMGRSPGSVKGLLERAKSMIYDRGRAYFLECAERDER